MSSGKLSIYQNLRQAADGRNTDQRVLGPAVSFAEDGHEPDTDVESHGPLFGASGAQPHRIANVAAINTAEIFVIIMSSM